MTETTQDDPYNELLWGGDFDEHQEAELERKNGDPQPTEGDRWRQGCEAGVRATLEVLDKLGAVYTDRLPVLLNNNFPHTLAGYCFEYALENTAKQPAGD